MVKNDDTTSGVTVGGGVGTRINYTFPEINWRKEQKRRCGRCNGKGEIWRNNKPERCPKCISFVRED